jgi:hypothetical protein
MNWTVQEQENAKKLIMEKVCQFLESSAPYIKFFSSLDLMRSIATPRVLVPTLLVPVDLALILAPHPGHIPDPAQLCQWLSLG